MRQDKWTAVRDGHFIRLRIDGGARTSDAAYVTGFVTYIRNAGEMPITEDIVLRLPLNLERRASFGAPAVPNDFAF